MSRAFVKDDDDGPEPVLDRPISTAPNYVTPRGLELLKAALAQATSQHDDREARYYQERIETAIVVNPSSRPRDVVEFAATVLAHDAKGTKLRVQIVGEDEADPVHGLVSYISPIAQAFTDHRVGDRVVVSRPAGPIEYTIDEIAY